MTNKQRINNQRQNFLLSFFNKKEEYQERKINKFWLVKHYNGNTGNWQVAIYPKGHLKRSKQLFNKEL